MDTKFNEKIRKFVLEGIDEKPVEAKPDLFWQNLRRTGTTLWLDTGDMDEAEKIWTAEMSALTTNNTLLNKEIQKGIYDDYIAQAQGLVKDLPIEQQIVEIAFILNARHGLRLVKKFGGFVSVELHTNIAHNYDAIIDYGLRFHAISPDHFIIKVPYTATGLLGARYLREHGVPINFTLEFSARQNVMVAAITKPTYLNVFLGRLGAYVKDNGLGDGTGAGERAVIASQNWVRRLTANNATSTRLIAASLRSADQLESLAGVDVFTMPTKVAATGRATLSGKFHSRLGEIYPVNLNKKADGCGVDKLWNVSEKEVNLALSLDADLPKTGQELIERVRDAGCGDLFPALSSEDLSYISEDGKIPKHERWEKRIHSGELAIDTLLNLAGLASFTMDQSKLDARVEGIIR